MTEPRPYVRPNQCRFCYSRCCYYSIISRDGSFDEVACLRHVRELEQLSDRHPGQKICSSSTAKQRRGRNAAEIFADFERRYEETQTEIARLKASGQWRW
jgi:hypothetical protein